MKRLVVVDFVAVNQSLAAGAVVDDTDGAWPFMDAAGISTVPYNAAVHDPVVAAFRTQLSKGQQRATLADMLQAELSVRGTFQFSWSTSSGTPTLATTAIALPTAPFFSLVTVVSSPAWAPGSQTNYLKCLKAGTYKATCSVVMSKTTAAQGAVLMIGKTSLIGTDILQPSLPVYIVNVPLGAAAPFEVTNILTLNAGDEICLLAEQQTVAAGTLGFLGPILMTIEAKA